MIDAISTMARITGLLDSGWCLLGGTTSSYRQNIFRVLYSGNREVWRLSRRAALEPKAPLCICRRIDRHHQVMRVEAVLRDYRAEDLDALYALDVMCFEPPFRFSRAAMRRFAQAPRARVVIAAIGETVAAFGILHIEKASAISGLLYPGLPTSSGFLPDKKPPRTPFPRACLPWNRSSPRRIGYLVTLDVDPRYRRLGLGGRVMAALEQQARNSGCGALLLHVSTGNEAAIGFYERRGFTRSHRVRRFYAAHEDAWMYHKVLS